MWGSFWLAIGLLYLLVGAGTIPPYSIKTRFPKLVARFVPLAFTTWAGALAAFARDFVLRGVLTALAIGSTSDCSLFVFSRPAVAYAVKTAAYFFIISSILAWRRVTVYLIEEA